MSRSSSEQGASPAKKIFEWSSELGAFKYYDKEKKENNEVPLPFRFMVLDKLSTIRGFSDTDKSGFWSNEVKDTRNQRLVVRTKKGTVAEGLYSEIKDRLAAQGAKYATQLYVAFFEDKELVIGCVTLVGAANSSFIDFSKDNNIYNGAIEISDFTDAKKGATKYKIPNFKKIEISESTEKTSIELDKEVQAYLIGHLATYNQPPAQKKELTEATANGNVNIKVKDTDNDWSDQIPDEKENLDPPF